MYGIYRCNHCHLVQTLPRPSDAELEKCYGAHYFENRTDRGYDNYFSETMRQNLERVWNLNLQDVGFLEFERSRPAGRSLDVGCASGFFVDYLRRRGWNAEGIELSKSAAQFGIEELGLTIHIQDFLKFEPTQKYDLVTLWASIEHLRSPRQALQKLHTMLKPGGMFILSTCRWGLLSRCLGPSWRFLNVPEHLYYFSPAVLEALANEIGFLRSGFITYGSGFTTRKNMGWLYRSSKSLADRAVKLLGQGDMMVYSYKRAD